MKAVLCLGRAGDVLNALPIAYKVWKDTGEKPGFIIQKDYADILEGVSYVEPVIYCGGFAEVGRAFNQFKGQYDISVAQVYGSNWKPKHDSFCRDAWDFAGFEPDFDSSLLVFDRRDTKMEYELIAEHIKGQTILVNFSGHSSPIQASERLLAVLSHSWGLKVTLVNLARVTSHRIYDLLGLYDTADLLITSDTATLHLAQASDIPSIQFITDRPLMWHGSTPKGNCVLSIRYSEIIKSMTKIHATIANVLHDSSRLQLL